MDTKADSLWAWFERTIAALVRIFYLVLLGIFYSVLTFVLFSILLWLVGALESLFGLNVFGIISKFGELVEPFAKGPFSSAIWECMKDPICQLLGFTSATVGATTATNQATRKQVLDEVSVRLSDQLNTCDEAWDVDAFLKGLTDAMKGGIEAPKQHMERASELLAAWDRYKAIVDPLSKDHNGDFARLRALLNGDQVPECKKTDIANGYISQEIWQLLSRIAKTADCRREAIVVALKNLMSSIDVVDLSDVKTRSSLPRPVNYGLSFLLGVGGTTFLFLLLIIFLIPKS